MTRARLNAQVVHGFCGYWGLLATGIFCIDVNVQYAAYPNVNNACTSGEQFGVQVPLREEEEEEEEFMRIQGYSRGTQGAQS